MTTTLNPELTEIEVERLRRRRSAKWSYYEDDVLPAWVAEMDFPLAAPVRAALVEAVELGDCGYAWPGEELGDAFAGFAAERLEWEVDPAAVSPSSDVVGAITAVLGEIASPGDRVVINPPVYHPFFALIEQLGCEVAEAPLAGGRLDLEAIERQLAAGAVALILCSPHNPTGGVPDRTELEAIAAAAERHGAWVLADEIHAPLTLPGARHVPFLTVSAAAAERGVAFCSASKAFNVAGLSCAQIVTASEPAAALVEALPFGATHCGHLGAVAAVAAFRAGGAWLDDVLAVLDHNRRLLAELLAERLPEVGYDEPQAGYLTWLDLRALELGEDPAEAILERGRVALSAGPQFGAQGAGFARLNVGTSPALLEQAVAGIARAVDVAELATQVGDGAPEVSAVDVEARRWLAAIEAETGPLSLFDTHTHFGRNDPDGFRQEPAELLATMEWADARAVTFPMHEPGGYREANDEALAAAAGSGGRLVPFCRVDPHREALAEATRCLDAGARGIKLHPRAEQFAMHEPAVRELVALADERRVPVLIHAGRGIPALGRDTVELAERHPHARLILAHGAVSDLAWLWRLMPERPNLFVDTSWWNPSDLIALFCLVPPAQILWASDCPYGQPIGSAALHLRCALAAGLGAEAIRSIAGGQIERILDGAEPANAGPPPGPGGALEPGMERVYSHLLSAMGRAMAEGDPQESLALARLACDAEGEHAAACAEVIRLLDLAERHMGPPPPGRAFPLAAHFVILALGVARTPQIALPEPVAD